MTIAQTLALDHTQASLHLQIASIALAIIIGRNLKSRMLLWLVSLLGALGVMVAHILVDGQGAPIIVPFLTPLIYFAAVVGRDEFRPNRK